MVGWKEGVCKHSWVRRDHAMNAVHVRALANVQVIRMRSSILEVRRFPVLDRQAFSSLKSWRIKAYVDDGDQDDVSKY